MIELYHAENCPYCVKVRIFMENEGIAYVSKPIPLGRSSKLKDELRSLGGKTQVPFLVDPERGERMYESDDIIEYLQQHYSPQRS
jgi:glutathione S-transferase